jgi:hypothetical protein
MITDEYRKADKAVKRMIRNAKRKFEKKLPDGCDGNSRPLYSYIKKKTNSSFALGALLSTENFPSDARGPFLPVCEYRKGAG